MCECADVQMRKCADMHICKFADGYAWLMGMQGSIQISLLWEGCDGLCGSREGFSRPAK